MGRKLGRRCLEIGRRRNRVLGLRRSDSDIEVQFEAGPVCPFVCRGSDSQTHESGIMINCQRNFNQSLDLACLLPNVDIHAISSPATTQMQRARSSSCSSLKLVYLVFLVITYFFERPPTPRFSWAAELSASPRYSSLRTGPRTGSDSLPPFGSSVTMSRRNGSGWGGMLNVICYILFLRFLLLVIWSERYMAGELTGNGRERELFMIKVGWPVN